MQLKEIILGTEKEKRAIGHFNIGSLDQLKAIAHVGMKLNVPVIIGVSEGERDYLGVHHVRDLIDSYNKEHGKNSPDGEGFWLFLNADHTHSLEKVEEVAVSPPAGGGFDAILFDRGELSLEENIQETKKAVEKIRDINPNILVEGELGYIGSGSEIRKESLDVAIREKQRFTSPDDAAKFVAETGVDLLAPSVGNIHGMFTRPDSPVGEEGGPAHSHDYPLDIDLIRKIKSAVNIPLVLHGASGNTDEEIRSAIEAGISIVHISTELRLAWRKGIEHSLEIHKDELAPSKLMPEVLEEMERLIEHKLRLFNNLPPTPLEEF